MGDMRRIVLAGETDFAGFRHAARGLLLEGVAPEWVSWTTAERAAGLDWYALQTQASASVSKAASGTPMVPAAIVALCEGAALHRDPQRFGLLYRLLWRLQQEPALRHDPLDPDLLALRALAQAVQRDQHKMKAFVRFRPLAGAAAGAPTGTAQPSLQAPSMPARIAAQTRAAVPSGAAEPPTHIAWFEPEHHIVEAVSPFFARRFTTLRWALLTPERSVRWDGQQLHFGPPARRDELPPADAGERLWLTYYESIFNPARLKLVALHKEMPRRYWRNLPEARLIAPLAATAGARSEAMLAREAALPRRRLPSTSVPARPEPAASSRKERSATPEMASPPPAPARAEGRPTPASEGARTLAELREATDRCRECPIGEHATQSVFGAGPIGARLMLVGEQPGDQEDLRGEPFVGPAGKLLDRALADLGWSRGELYVTNAVKHFKFELRGKRRMHKTPVQREVAACHHWLEAEIERVRPAAIVALGATAARSLLGRQVAVLSERGQWLKRADGLPVLITLHPSALLRGDPADRENAYALWLADLRKATRRKAAGD